LNSRNSQNQNSGSTKSSTIENSKLLGSETSKESKDKERILNNRALPVATGAFQPFVPGKINTNVPEQTTSKPFLPIL